MTDIKATLITTVTDAISSDLAGKPFYKSKTFWTNVVAIGGMLAQMKYGFIVSVELQTLALSVINLALRAVTKEPIILS